MDRFLDRPTPASDPEPDGKFVEAEPSPVASDRPPDQITDIPKLYRAPTNDLDPAVMNRPWTCRSAWFEGRRVRVRYVVIGAHSLLVWATMGSSYRAAPGPLARSTGLSPPSAGR